MKQATDMYTASEKQAAKNEAAIQDVIYDMPAYWQGDYAELFTKKPNTLLSVGKDAKTKKGAIHGVLTGVLYMTPANGSTRNLCPMAALAKCAAPCLNTAGRGKMGNVQAARLRKAEFFNQYLEEFKALVIKDIEKLVRKAKREDLTPMVRLNGTTDIKWEKVFPEMFEAFPDVQFYDYTKSPVRDVSHIPNYHLTWSYSGVEGYAKYAQVAIERGMNVAVVFRDEFPETFLGLPVVDGDESDIRPWDTEDSDHTQVVVGLKAKGDAKDDTSGFVVDPDVVPLPMADVTNITAQAN